MADDGMQTRSHLEAQLASALALKSPNEYRQCLMSYVRYLARFVGLLPYRFALVEVLVNYIISRILFVVFMLFHHLIHSLYSLSLKSKVKVDLAAFTVTCFYC